MNDVTGMPQSVVVLGGSSDIARSVLLELAKRRLDHVLLAGRDAESLEETARALVTAKVKSVETATFDVCDTSSHRAFAADAKRRLGAIDLVIVAAGLLGSADLDTLDAANVAQSITTNFTGPAVAILELAAVLREQGYGRVVVLSSVAGVRVRRSNFVYGAGKAGLDGFCQGLADALHGSGVAITIVRPGFVHTKMTAGMAPAPLASTPEDVAVGIVRGIERGDAVVWSPSKLRPAFALLRVLPRALWRLIPG